MIAPKDWVESVHDGMKEMGFGTMQDRSVGLEARQGNVTRTTCWDAKVKSVWKSFNDKAQQMEMV